jgi:hypothetical protein
LKLRFRLGRWFFITRCVSEGSIKSGFYGHCS